MVSLAVVLTLIDGCAPKPLGSQPLLLVGTQAVTVQPSADSTQRADVSYTLGQPAQLSITLIKPDGQDLVLRGPDQRLPDTYAYPFSGVVDVPNSSDKQVLPDGRYKLLFQVKAADGRSAQQTVDAVVKNADPVPLVVDNLRLSLGTFSPNGQGVRPLPGAPPAPGTQDPQQENLDQTTLDYSVSKSSDIRIWVTDAEGVETPIDSKLAFGTKAGEQSFLWNGKTASGVALLNGTYVIHVQASDASGNISEKTIPVTIADSGIPEVQIVSAKFTPTALGINGILHVEVSIKNTGNVPIKTKGPPPGTAYTTNMSYLDPSFNKPGDIVPPYYDLAGRWRVAVHWTSGLQNYPVRWGFFQDDNRELLPGQQVTVNGTIQIQEPQPPNINFWAAIEMGGIGFTKDYGQTNVIIGFPDRG